MNDYTKFRTSGNKFAEAIKRVKVNNQQQLQSLVERPKTSSINQNKEQQFITSHNKSSGDAYQYCQKQKNQTRKYLKNLHIINSTDDLKSMRNVSIHNKIVRDVKKKINHGQIAYKDEYNSGISPDSSFKQLLMATPVSQRREFIITSYGNDKQEKQKSAEKKVYDAIINGNTDMTIRPVTAAQLT